jgi:hypothetical protein
MTSYTGNGANRLLVGENPTTTSRVVAARWVRIYPDLILAKDSLLTELRASIARSLPEGGYELEQIDGTYLAAQRSRYRLRLAFWKQRQVELSTSGRSAPRDPPRQ